MLISDIRMKSRGVSLPHSQSAAGRLAQHTDQHPGITRLIIMSTLSSLIVMTHAVSANLCLRAKIEWQASVCTLIFLLYSSDRVIEP